MSKQQYQCLRCGAFGYSVRCGACGGDAEPVDTIEPPSGYTIFSHAQLGHTEFLSERHDKAKSRRFTGEPPTGFGGL